MKSDESSPEAARYRACASRISNPEIGQSLIEPSNLRFRISGFEMQDSSDFEIFA